MLQQNDMNQAIVSQNCYMHDRTLEYEYTSKEGCFLLFESYADVVRKKKNKINKTLFGFEA